MLSKELEEKIEEAGILTDFDKIEDMDMLTDFDGTMIIERSPYIQTFNYISYLWEQHSYKNLRKVIIKILRYEISKDIRNFFYLFEECPIEVIDKSTDKLRQNDEWLNVIERLKPEKIGIVSRNNRGFIKRYLDTKELSDKVKIIVANVPEIKNGIYTGNVKLYVNNGNIRDIIGKKEYICGKEEMKILKNFEMFSKNLKRGLYICSKKRIF